MKNFLILLIFFIKGNVLLSDNLLIKIAVVEYQPIENVSWSREEIVEANTFQYIQLLQSSNISGLNLIVYPEDTLRSNGATAVEIDFDNPCNSDNYPKYMKDLSCAARKFNTYIVVNLVEKSKCFNDLKSANCKKYGFYFYNTDVVFDNDGTIVNRYRKFHLFGEHDRDRPLTPEKVIIETNFGVNFGIFTCFDILFKSPAQDLVDDKVKNIIYPSMWFSELPFLTALQTQQMWAHTHNVRLYASGANKPKVGSGGTGIYDGSEGAMLFDIIANGGSKVYIYKYINGNSSVNPQEPMGTQDVDVLAKEMDNFQLRIDPNIKRYKSVVLNTSEKISKTKLCDNNLCCDFEFKLSLNNSISQKNSYTYLMVTYSGINSFGGMYNGGVELCGIIACLDSSIKSCGRRFFKYEEINWPVTFEQITIKGIFENNENKMQYPNSLLSSIRPINASDTEWTRQEVEVNGTIMIERTFATKKLQDRLFTFAIFGRNFAQDSPPKTQKCNYDFSTIFTEANSVSVKLV